MFLANNVRFSSLTLEAQWPLIMLRRKIFPNCTEWSLHFRYANRGKRFAIPALQDTKCNHCECSLGTLVLAFSHGDSTLLPLPLGSQWRTCQIEGERRWLYNPLNPIKSLRLDFTERIVWHSNHRTSFSAQILIAGLKALDQEITDLAQVGKNSELVFLVLGAMFNLKGLRAVEIVPKASGAPSYQYSWQEFSWMILEYDNDYGSLLIVAKNPALNYSKSSMYWRNKGGDYINWNKLQGCELFVHHELVRWHHVWRCDVEISTIQRVIANVVTVQISGRQQLPSCPSSWACT